MNSLYRVSLLNFTKNLFLTHQVNRNRQLYQIIQSTNTLHHFLISMYFLDAFIIKMQLFDDEHIMNYSFSVVEKLVDNFFLISYSSTIQVFRGIL